MQANTDTQPPITIIENLTTKLVVGLEVHVELNTRTKMWTAAPNLACASVFNENPEPNTLTDPVVIGMPGTLPVMNKAALEASIKVGLALNCSIAHFTKWDRKSYYYPDLPKNYQISQYDLPLCYEGNLDVPLSDEPDAPTAPIRITRAHLEEDAGKLLHEAPGGVPIDHSIVDLNRAGTPLLEIVTEPDFHTADHAVAFCRMLQNLVRFLNASEADMQRGHIRFEPNINVIIERDGQTYKTPITEIKNLNSYRAVHAAIEHEHVRQVHQWLEDGRVMGPGVKSTRGWDDQKLVTFAQREKEDAHDYRYFPDPDLIPVTLTEEQIDRIRCELPELPHQKLARYTNEYGLKPVDARALTADAATSGFYEQTIGAGVEPKRAATILRNSLGKIANERGTEMSRLDITAQQIAAVEQLLKDNKISSNNAEQLYGLCIDSDSTVAPADLAQEHGLMQVSDDGALDDWINQAITQQPQAAEQFRSGKEAALGRLTGTVMKLSKGQANPKAVQQRLRDKLST